MSARVTVTLPDDTYRRAEYLARMTGRGVADVLADTIGLSLRPLGAQPTDDRTIGEFSDADVLVIADSQMDSAQDERLRELLGKQQAGRLTDEEYRRYHEPYINVIRAPKGDIPAHIAAVGVRLEDAARDSPQPARRARRLIVTAMGGRRDDVLGVCRKSL